MKNTCGCGYKPGSDECKNSHPIFNPDEFFNGAQWSEHMGVTQNRTAVVPGLASSPTISRAVLLEKIEALKEKPREVYLPYMDGYLAALDAMIAVINGNY